MKKWTLVTAVACLVGLAGNFACGWRHTCIGGHMEHPPYHVGEYLLDVGWCGALIFSALAYRKAQLRHPKVFLTLVLLLMASRLFASFIIRFRVRPDLVDLPIVLYLIAVSIKMIWTVVRTGRPLNSENEKSA